MHVLCKSPCDMGVHHDQVCTLMMVAKSCFHAVAGRCMQHAMLQCLNSTAMLLLLCPSLCAGTVVVRGE
jgi:hypothetical protein